MATQPKSRSPATPMFRPRAVPRTRRPNRELKTANRELLFSPREHRGHREGNR